MINGQEVDTHITINMGNALASIEKNQKHTWTGIFSQENFVLTTGKVAEEIHKLMKENNAGTCIRVCYLVTPMKGNCISVLNVMLHAEYLLFNVENGVNAVSFNPHDVGILVVGSSNRVYEDYKLNLHIWHTKNQVLYLPEAWCYILLNSNKPTFDIRLNKQFVLIKKTLFNATKLFVMPHIFRRKKEHNFCL